MYNRLISVFVCDNEVVGSHVFEVVRAYALGYVGLIGVVGKADG